jgi:S1-C subfamily serine protease
VLKVKVDLCDGSATGSGFLISNRLVATVEHVVDGATNLSVSTGQTEVAAQVIGADPDVDLALLRTVAPLKGFVFHFASTEPSLGSEIAVLGYPLGLPLTVTRGTVSGTGRTVKINGISRRDLVQTDAAMNPGNSGGPLIESGTGRVLGLADLKNLSGSGLGFAVSARTAAPLLDAWQLAPQNVPLTKCG